MLNLLYGYIENSLPEGKLTTSPGLRAKVDDAGAFLPFEGNTVVFLLSDEEKAALSVLQDSLYATASHLLAQRLSPDTFHMTLHDLANGAPCVIVVLGDPENYPVVENGSLVLGNLMNAAHAVGLGSCWIHRAKQMFETEEGKALLRAWGLKDTLIGIGNCILGYPVETPEARPRLDGRIVKIG